jgi:hypothetical protein
MLSTGLHFASESTWPRILGSKDPRRPFDVRTRRQMKSVRAPDWSWEDRQDLVCEGKLRRISVMLSAIRSATTLKTSAFAF